MSKVRKALLDSTVASFLMQALAMLSVVLIARLLTPEEIGTYAVVSALVMLLSQFKDSGAGTYLIRESVIDSDKIRSALGVTLLISWVLIAFLVGASFLVAAFYGIPEAPLVIGILSLTYLVSPYVSIPHALLVRSLRFDTIRNIEFISTALGLVATIILALGGFSYFAIAIGYLADYLCRLFIINVFVRQDAMRYCPSFKNIGEIIKLGVATTSSDFLKQGTQSGPDLVIGKLGSVFDVGIFSRGLGFVKFVGQTLSTGIGAISLSYISEIKRNGEDLAKAYIRGSYLFNGFAMPVYWVAAVVSLPIIRFLFGPQWDAAAPIASALLIWGSIKALNFQFHHFMIVINQKKIMVLRDLYNLLAIILSCVLFYQFGLLAIACSFIAVALIESVILLFTMRAALGVSVWSFTLFSLKNVLIAACCMGSSALLDILFVFETIKPLYSILILALTMPFVLLFLLFIFKHPLFEEIRRIVKSKLRG